MSKETNNGKKGGLLKGKSHDDGGIKAIVVDTGQPVELEAEEIIINKKSAKKHRALLSKINQDGGGVAIPSPDEYKYGGEVVEFNRNDKPHTFAMKFARKIKKDMPDIWKKYGNSFENNLFNTLDKVFARGYWKPSEKDQYKVWKMYCFNNQSKDDIDSIVGMFKCGAVTSKGYSYMKKKVEALNKGTEVEMEHEETLKKVSSGEHSVEEGAKMIAEDHLKESETYYEDLEKMEENYTKEDTKSMKHGGSIEDQYSKVKGDLVKAEKLQSTAKEINKAIRDSKLTDTKEIVAMLLEKNYPKDLVSSLRSYADGRHKVPAYILTNNNSKIKRLKDKVNLLKAQLDSSSGGGEADRYNFADGHVLVNPDIDRVQIIFDDTYVPKPLFKKLRSNGWVFSRTNGAFQRKLTPQAIDNAVQMFEAKKEGATPEKKVQKVEQRIGTEEAMDMVNNRQFSYVSVYLRKALEGTGYDGETYPRLVYLSQMGHEVSEGVRAYFKKHFPKLDVDKMEIQAYKKTYIRESRDLVKAGRYLPSDESPETVLTSKLAEELKSFFGEGATPPKKAKKTYYFLETTKVKRTENGKTEDDLFKRAESISGLINTDKSDILSSDVVIETDSGVEYEVDMNKITLEKITPQQTKYKIDGKTYDLTDVVLPEDHPIMILDTDSPQWKSSVKEYFDSKNSSTKTGKQNVSGSDKSGSELEAIINSILKYKESAKADYGAVWSKLTLPYGMLKKLWKSLDDVGVDRFVKKGLPPEKAEYSGYKFDFIVDPDRRFWTEVETPTGEVFKLQRPEIAGSERVNARFYLGEEKDEETEFIAPDPVKNKEKSSEGLDAVADKFKQIAKHKAEFEAVEVVEPNTGEDFDQAVMDGIEPKDDWIGNLIKERDVKKQIADLIKGGDENERELAISRIYQKFYDQELENSDKWTSKEEWYSKIKEILNGYTKDSTKTELLMDGYSTYLTSSKSLGYNPEKVVAYILEKEDQKQPELNLSDSDPEHAFKGIEHDYKNQYVLNKAIEALIDDRGDSPSDYDSDEKNFVRKYSGYGGLGNFGTTGKGGFYEFYTPPEIIERMWGLAYKYGYNDGDVLEPAVGTGEFLHYMPKNAEVVAYDINEYSSKIVKISFPTVEMNVQPFEQLFISKNYTVKGNIDHLKKFDLVIGNPPYGSFDDFQSRFMAMGEKDHVKPRNYVEYFLRRSVDLLKPDGLLVFIVGAQLKNGGTMFLDGGETPVKEYLAQHTEFLTAYRLPDTVFERTGVTSDIIVLKKK